MAQIARIRWPRDVRRDNVRAMLDSTKPVLIATQHLDAGTDGEIREAQEQFLLATWTRYLSQAFGRAFFTFRLAHLRTRYKFVIILSISYVPEMNSLIIEDHLKHLREWGEFYNGVSAGLSIVGADVARVDHEWLTLCHTNDKISPPTAAGLIYAFGMNGHLPNFNMFHIHEVLASLDKFPSIALLLGMAMSKLGTGDRQVHKMLTTHLPFLMGPTMLNLKIDPLIQTSAVSGLGLDDYSLIHLLIHTACLTILQDTFQLLFCQQNCGDGPPVYALAVDSEVTLSLGTGRLLLRHNVPFSIRQLLWVVFPPSKSEIETACTQEFFCLVGTRDLMFIAVNDSHPLGYRLQFDLRSLKIHAVHVTKFGLLVERDISSRDTSTQEVVALYSLSHPLNELLAVIFKPRGSGASINTGRIHTGSGTVGSGSLIRSVHTRSMTARMARTRSFPHPPHAPPTDSPALSIFSPMSLGQHSEAANTTASQLYDPVHQIITPKMQVFSRELQRQPDFDLLLAELCLDHIWAEPSKRDASGEIASKMFLSHNVLSQDFLNFFLGAVGQLRSIRVVRTVGNITTSGTLGFVPCRDAVGIRNGDLTVVLEMDNSIGLYSGQIKCAVAVIPRFTISPSMLLISVDNLSFAVQYGSQITKIKVPALFDNSLARDVLTAVVDVLPREKAMHLMLDWRVRSRNCGNDLDTAVSERQLHSVLRFLLKQCGVSIGHHDKLPWRKIQHKSDDSEVDAKQRRPKASAEMVCLDKGILFGAATKLNAVFILFI
ncbi:unnamed protein product [Angiostrongylus costaricensis]|uniref:Anaphase-promoting complex subunit 1 n=1 Tax=Angiostrongylus costaricensis TaxID=334426 RepID=A0A158PML6_ANGCS|nr:unnamed protein product [Angiostrongylus costaricensis]